MMTANESEDQTAPEAEEGRSLQEVQGHYLRCPSPSFSVDSRFSRLSRFSDMASVLMEPIHLSSAVAAKKIISEELPPPTSRAESVSESMLESAEQLMVEDLYNRVRDLTDDRSPYNTPCVLDLQRALVHERPMAPDDPLNEVWPNVFIGDKSAAVNKARLRRMGVTHVLNAAHGTGVYTGESFYAGMDVCYLGIEVDDFPDVDISVHFRSTAEFLDEALLTHRGKVLVVSVMGSSRAPILVASYLMIFQHLSVLEALTAIRSKRPISPNEGFLKQLRQLNEDLMEERDDDDDTLSQSSVIDARTRAAICGEDEERSLVGVEARSIMVEEEEDGTSVFSSEATSAAALQDTSERPSQTDADDKDLENMIHEWQRRNEMFQSEDWWEEKLDSDGGEDGEVDSVTSEDIRTVNERLRRRATSEASSSSCTSFSDLWRQRLKEIEEQAAARYHGNAREEHRRKKVDEDMESVLSETTSMQSFCQRNKDKMTPLERWRVKRIQFGWNKKDREEDEEKTPENHGGLEDVDLSAYQAWKLRQQRRLGEDDKDEILEMSRGDDSAAAKRRQKREELLERSRRTLEESKSVCGWGAEGSAIPLSAFRAGANDDGASMLSSRSSVPSRARSTCSSMAPPPLLPVLPGPSAQGPEGETMVDLASIQHWIANVVSETIRQKQSEMNPPPPILAGSEVGYEERASVLGGASFTGGAPSMLGGASFTGGAPSMLGGASFTGGAPSVLGGASFTGGAPSMLGGRAAALLGGASLGSGAASVLSGRSRAPGWVEEKKKKKVTTTSVPLFSLFQDQVNLGELNALDQEMKAEMRGKMAAYEKKKILEDNKRSTLYKKKKPKDEEEEEKKKEKEFLGEVKKKQKPPRSFGLSGRLNLTPALESDKNMSISDWLRSVRPPADNSDDVDASASEFGYEEEEQEEEEEEEEESSFSRRSAQSYDDEEGDDIAAFIAQTRRRAQARAAAEVDDDEVLAAWRAQQEARGGAETDTDTQ